MTDTTILRRLHPADAAALMALRREALTNEPSVFGSSPVDDRMGSVEYVRNALADVDEQAVFGRFHETRLVGLVGVIRESGLKERHKAHVWGMYVTPSARGQGVGRRLIETAIEHARGWAGVERLLLSVTESGVAARALYEAAGFRIWGREPRALVWEGRFVDEHHLALELHPSPSTNSNDQFK